MARKGQTKLRKLVPESKFQSATVTRLINRSMRDGKKMAAEKQVYSFLDLLKKEINSDPVVYLEQAIDNIRPKTEVRPRRIGGAVYQVPTPVRGHRQMSLAIRWLVESSRNRPNKQFHTFAEKLLAEVKDAYAGQGAAVTKRSEVERMAEANKAFAHLHW